MVTLGILTDIHDDVESAVKVADAISKHKPSLVCLIGDVGVKAETIAAAAYHVLFRSGAQIAYMFPGSHETRSEYQAAMAFLRQKCPFVQDGMIKPCIAMGDLRVAAIPGSDVVAGGDYAFGPKLNPARVEKFLDCENLVLLSHVPKRFTTTNAPDYASFVKFFPPLLPQSVLPIAEVERRMNAGTERIIMSALESDYRKASSGIPYRTSVVPAAAFSSYAKHLGFSDAFCDAMTSKENVGNLTIEDIVRRHGVKKMVSGHIHEAGERAVNLAEEPVKEGDFVDELFLNPGPVFEGKGGIVRFDTKTHKAAYWQIRV
ncbi:hypothetical protein HY642_05245 [Candidatus Woesearchaeota archaeon]|nr:hypothetical protein [Candidatus Woesearchaeota archaeon]